MSVDKKQYCGLGRRKTSVARVILQEGDGQVIINKRKIENYIFSKTKCSDTVYPLKLTNNLDKYNVFVNVKGGGLMSQAGAIRLGIAKSLLMIDPELRIILKKAGLLTRDSRVVERKKYGLKKARRAPQFSKR